jgi:hypothetical protein
VTEQSPLVALEQTRNQFISVGVKCAEIIRELREIQTNPVILVKQGGGLAIIWDQDNGKYRFSHPSDRRVVSFPEPLDVVRRRWNRAAPDMAVDEVSWIQALEFECYSVFASLSFVEKHRLKLEAQS